MSDDVKMETAAVAVAVVAEVCNGESTHVSAVVTSEEPQVRRPGEAPVKREYLKPAELIPRPPADPRDRDGGVVGGEDGERSGGKGKRVRGTFKKRPIDAVADAAQLLCRAVAAGGACNFFETCKFSHDVDDYMKRKEKDLGDACPLFTAFQFCRYGVTCRFARAHTAKVDGTHRNVDERPLDQRSVDDPSMLHETNALTDTVRMQLRKNTYPFASAQQNKKKKYQKGGGKQQNRNQEKAEQAAAAAAAVAAATMTEATEEDVQEDGKAEAGVQEPMETPDEPLVQETKPPIEEVETSESPLLPERKRVDFKRKIYVAPLTTVGNLPFRRLMKQLGADITCGEMAMATNLLKAQQSEWALLRRHASEDVFGVQLAGAYGDQMARVCEMLARDTDVDFIDMNMGCPIDIVCKAGAGSALMTRPPRLLEVISGALTGIELGSRFRAFAPPGLTVKLRTGWSDKTPVAHKLVPKIQSTRASSLYMNASVVQDYKLRAVQSVDAITVHGRSRLQRYTKNADWDYVFDCSDALETTEETENEDGIAMIGGGDVMSFQEFDDHLKNGKLATCMIARGALIKPWLPTEIKERRHMDISSSERLELLKDFVHFGLEHWGSDQKGVNRTRRYLLEWQSFLCRYIPVGLLEVLPQRINSRPAPYYGRDDLETLMGSDQAVDWVKISEMLLGPVPSDFQFQPKHKANAYTTA